MKIFLLILFLTCLNLSGQELKVLNTPYDFKNDFDKDGVIDIDDICPRTKGEKDYNGCQDSLFRRSCGSTLSPDTLFKGTSVEWIPGFTKTLEEYTKRAIATPGIQLVLQGHTDARGEEQANLKRSLERAENIKAFMVKVGMPPEQIITIGVGSRDIVNNCSKGVICSEQKHNENNIVYVFPDRLANYLPIKNIDWDDDGISQEFDSCPSIKGVIKNFGCLNTKKVERKICTIQEQTITFRPKSDVLSEKGDSVLNEVIVPTLKRENPTSEKIILAVPSFYVANQSIHLKRAQKLQKILSEINIIPANRIRIVYDSQQENKDEVLFYFSKPLTCFNPDAGKM